MSQHALEWGIDSNRIPKQGDMVVIPKGAWITGTHSKLPKHAGRTYRVKVNWYDEYHGEVTWAGEGGYWHRTIEWYWPKEEMDGEARCPQWR